MVTKYDPTVWDYRFIDMARVFSLYSKDPDHQVGAVIANEKHLMISEGYNGPPPNIEDTDLPREREVLRTLHAELNAILNAEAPSLKNCTLYVYPYSPCAQCAAAIVKAEIGRVVYAKKDILPSWEKSQMEAKSMLIEAGIPLIWVDPTPIG